jgi:hypothetical protein
MTRAANGGLQSEESAARYAQAALKQRRYQQNTTFDPSPQKPFGSRLVRGGNPNNDRTGDEVVQGPPFSIEEHRN